MENDCTYSDKQRQLYQDRLDELNTEKQARLDTITKSKRSSDAGRKDQTGS